MVVGNLWLKSLLIVRSGEASGMSQLQSNQQVVSAADVFQMSLLKENSQPFQIAHCLRVDQELVGVGTTVGSDSHCFTAPDEFRSAESEILPATTGQVCRTAVSCSVPAFHRQDTPAIADSAANRTQRLIQRCMRASLHGLIKGQVQFEFIQTLLKLVWRFQRGNAGE